MAHAEANINVIEALCIYFRYVLIYKTCQVSIHEPDLCGISKVKAKITAFLSLETVCNYHRVFQL